MILLFSGAPFLVLAASPQPPTEKVHLISDPVACQKGDGELSFRHWASRGVISDIVNITIK